APQPAAPVDAFLAGGASAVEIANGSPDSAMLGWHLEVAGDKARFYACDNETTCGMRVIELPAKEVKSVKVVGRAEPKRADETPDGETDVLRIVLAHPFNTSRGGAAYDTSHGLTMGGRSK